jgi:hypothetical protein
MKAPLKIATTAALLMSGSVLMSSAALAGTSTPSEFRGYQACLKANADAVRGLVPERTYLIDESAQSRTYYINATAWQNGERVEVGMSCETNRSGRLIENKGVSLTRYAPASEAIQVAGK